MGCGRTGSRLAAMLSAEHHEVVVIDWRESAFQRLPEDFPGQTVLGNAVDQHVLREAGIASADVFIAATSGDNRNIMASEVARTVFGVQRVISRVKDPNRASLFSSLGIEVDCRTTQGARAILQRIGQEDLIGLPS